MKKGILVLLGIIIDQFIFAQTIQFHKQEWMVFVKAVNIWTSRNVDNVKGQILKNDTIVVDSMMLNNDGQLMARLFVAGNYVLRITHKNYDTMNQLFTLTKHKTHVNIRIPMKPRLRYSVKELSDVKIQATRVKMVMKGDTVVFDARAFETMEGSMLEELIKQLPGVKLDDKGCITLNGKFVSSLLINGKDFFKGNPNVALQNLPVYMVDKVKGYERIRRGTNKEDLSAKEMVLDVILKKEYSHTYVGNMDLGMGTHNRYAEHLFGLRFTDFNRIAFYGTINNINDNRRPGANGNWQPTDLNGGLFAQKEAGFYYSYDNNNKLQLDFEGRVIHLNNDFQQETSVETYIPLQTIYSRQKQDNRNRSTSWEAKAGFNYDGKLDIAPSFNYQTHNINTECLYALFNNRPENYLTGNVLSGLFLDDVNFGGSVVNSQKSRVIGYGNIFKLSTPFFCIINLGGTDFYLNGDIDYSHNRDNTFAKNDYYYYNPTSSDERNEYRLKPEKEFGQKWRLSSSVSIRRDKKNNWSFQPNYIVEYRYHNSDFSLYRLDSLSGWNKDLGILPSTRDSLLLALDIRNSHYATHHDLMQTFDPYFQLQFYFPDKKFVQFDARLHLPMQWTQNRLKYRQALCDTMMTRYTFFMLPDFQFRLMSRVCVLELKYKLLVTLPSQTQLIDVVDNADPLNIRLGNSSLRAIHHHNLTASIQQTIKDGGLSTSVNWFAIRNALSEAIFYDSQTGVSTWRPENINGNWGTSLNFNINRSVDKDKRFTVQDQLEGVFNHNVDFISESLQKERSTVRWFTLNEELKGDYRVKTFAIGAKIGIEWLSAHSKRTNFEPVNSTNLRGGVNGQIELPFDFEIATDFTVYARRGYSDAMLNATDYVWNARLSKRFLKAKTATVALDAFDLLHDLSNIRYVLNAQGRTEVHQNVVPNYLMLHFIYHFDKKNTNKKEDH